MGKGKKGREFKTRLQAKFGGRLWEKGPAKAGVSSSREIQGSAEPSVPRAQVYEKTSKVSPVEVALIISWINTIFSFQAPLFEPILSNVYHRFCKPVYVDVIDEPCHCSSLKKTGKICLPGSGCVNTQLAVECTEASCGDATRCCNRVSGIGSSETLVVFETKRKGFGLKTTVDITKGQFIIEYVGEVIPAHVYMKRFQAKKSTDPVYYMQLNNEQFLDAELKGNLSRLINHSCDPNCRVYEYVAQHRTVLGVFAAMDISAGSELTYDYQFEMAGDPRPCYCESKVCRGTINKPNNAPVRHNSYS